MLYVSSFMCATWLNPYDNSMKDMLVFLLLMIKEVGLNDITYGTQSLTTSKWQSQNSNLGLSNSKVHILPTKWLPAA